MTSRVKYTARNIYASYLLMGIQILFQFVSKSVIVYTLGDKYLGLSSLFSSVLSVLNIAELGFSASVVYCMYEPLAKGDTERVCALLSYLRKIYRAIGLIIAIIGVILTPFIQFIIKGDVPTEINVYILYLLYLINTSLSYFLFAYKTALLTAIQRLDLTKIATCIVTIIQYGLQLVALLYFHNYYLFVLSMIMGTALINLFTAYISKKKYPEYKCYGEIDAVDKNNIIEKVKGLLICNISIVTYKSLDSIVISTFVGLSSVAIYNNYIVIYSAVTSLITVIRTAMQSSVGNSVASESLEKNYNDLRLWQFLFSVIATWCVTCMICLYQPFMRIWMGENLLLPMSDVVLIGIWFMVDSVQQAYYVYLSATGLWNEMKWSYVFNTCCNLFMNIILGKLFGVTGIIVASLLTCVISGTFWQCMIIFKKYFKRSAKIYIVSQFLYFAVAIIVAGTTYIVCSYVKIVGIFEIVIKLLICCVNSAAIMFLVYRKTKYFSKSKELFFRAIHNK